MKFVYKPQEKVYQFEAESKTPFTGARQADIKFDRRCTNKVRLSSFSRQKDFLN